MNEQASELRSLLELQVLGGIDLRLGERELREVIAQTKRFGVLVFLVLCRPGEFVRRDELLGMFWPESTETRARASLRQTLRFLRTHLGGDTIVNRGDADVRIDAARLACDALAFDHALRSGDDRAAIDVYGGELLPGFNLPNAHEFDRWLDGERKRLATGAVQAALRLSAGAEHAGRLDDAVATLRWALQLGPTNEAVARRLITLLAESGNRAGAVEAFEALRDRLSDELGVPPSAETMEAVAAVETDPRAVGHGGRYRLEHWSLSRQRVLVLGLDNLTGDPGLSALGRLAADALANGLAAVAELEVVPPLASGGTVVSGPEAQLSEGLDVARRVGAGTLIRGTYHVEGGQVCYRVQIMAVDSGRVLEAPPPAFTPVSAPTAVLQDLAEQVATYLAPALGGRVVHVRRAARPPGIEAYGAYLQGLDLFIGGDWQASLSRFRHSVDLEPEYALPRIVSAIALWNLGDLADAKAAAGEAATLRDTVGPFEQALLDMVRAWLDGDWAAAHRAARVQADLAPGSIPHFQVAEEARRLNRPREARQILAALEPEVGELRGWIFYWVELASAHHLLGEHERELDVASRCRQLYPVDSRAVLLEVRALAALGRVTDLDQLIDLALAMPGSRSPDHGTLMREAALELRAHDWSEHAQPLLDRAVDWYRDRVAHDSDNEPLRRDLARTLYHAGRLDEATVTFRELAERSGGHFPNAGHHHGQLQAHLDQGYLAVIAARRGDNAGATRWSEWLRDLDRPFLYGAHWFWLAVVAAARDDRDRAVTMLGRAFADGLPFEMFIHTEPHLLALRGHARFDALMRPKG